MPETATGQLDYDPEPLTKMDFASIKNQPFDRAPHKPRKTAAKISPDMLAKDLSAKLANGTKIEQIEYFASLNIDEWEDAGDWIIDQYAQIMARLKGVRKEKRKQARAFEDEIEQRYNAVSLKKQMTEDALGFMKDSGVRVLENTPRKR